MKPKKSFFNITFKLNRYGVLGIIVDAIIFAASFAIAFVWRYDVDIPNAQLIILRNFILPVVLIKLVIFYLWGIYHRVWRYASVNSFLNIGLANVVGSLAVVALLFFILRLPIARGVLALDGLLSLALTTGARFVMRGLREFRSKSFWFASVKPILIAGAGDTGAAIVREMLSRPEMAFQPIGFIDDDPLKQGMQVHGVRILGTRANLSKILQQHQVKEVIICMPNSSRAVIRDIFFRCQEAGVKCRTLPGIYQIIDGKVNISQIREVGVEDILGREPVTIDLDKVASLIAGKAILVTGASGSIGAELCRQIYQLKPASLIMVDQNESGLFQIEQELSMRQGAIPAIPVIADITNRTRIKAIFDKHRPSIVFHAAAYKHVPMMEKCLTEAIDNNVFGTRTVAETATQYGAEKFVFVSTDKAVEPISVMGTSKALAEKLVQTLALDSPTKFIIVRFGNVLASSGSVIPTFRQQIIRGGPVTVTHPEMTRYFMTIPEAMQLVIQAAAMGQGGEIFVLEMGEQIKIVELARNMIKLSGFTPDKDIPIVFTGIRPGEKLCEKLFWDHEEIVQTKHKKILMARNTSLDIAKFKDDIKQLEKAINLGKPEKVQEILSQMYASHLGGTRVEKNGE